MNKSEYILRAGYILLAIGLILLIYGVILDVLSVKKIKKEDSFIFEIRDDLTGLNLTALVKMDNYRKMVKAILEHMTEGELALQTGRTERDVTGWENGAIPQDMSVQKTIKRLYKEFK